jgi:hypothetical protein
LNSSVKYWAAEKYPSPMLNWLEFFGACFGEQSKKKLEIIAKEKILTNTQFIHALFVAEIDSNQHISIESKEHRYKRQFFDENSCI